MHWVKDDSGLSLRDIQKKQAYKFEAHSFVSSKKLPYQRCKKCGLVTLRNDFTAWCLKMGCNSRDHAGYAERCRSTRAR